MTTSVFPINDQEEDPESGLYDLTDRNLDAAVGGFTQPDRLWEQFPSVSSYSYANANPLRLTDPDGKQVMTAAIKDAEDPGKLGGAVQSMPVPSIDWSFMARGAAAIGRAVGTIATAAGFSIGPALIGTSTAIIPKHASTVSASSSKSSSGKATTGEAGKTKAVSRAESLGEAMAQGASSNGYVPKDENGNPRPIPRDKNGNLQPDSEHPHTQLGWRQGRNGSYRQGMEWGKDHKLIRRIDFTNHGRADHVSPHWHPALPNSPTVTPGPVAGTFEWGNAQSYWFLRVK